MVPETVLEAEPERHRSEEREVVGLDPLLQLVALGLGDPAGRDRSVDLVLERLLERAAELLRLHAELLRGIVDNRLALRAGGRAELRGGDAGARAADRDCDDGPGDDLPFERPVHGSPFGLHRASGNQRDLRRP